MKTYITFGQVHLHEVNGKVLSKDTVAVINCENANEGRNIAVKLFGKYFCFSYYEEQFDMDSMKFFPKGFVEVN